MKYGSGERVPAPPVLDAHGLAAGPEEAQLSSSNSWVPSDGFLASGCSSSHHGVTPGWRRSGGQEFQATHKVGCRKEAGKAPRHGAQRWGGTGLRDGGGTGLRDGGC